LIDGTSTYALLISRPETSSKEDTAITGETADKPSKYTHLEITVTGTAYSVAEVGEILGWIGAALSSSKVDGTIDYQGTPICDIVPKDIGGEGLLRWEAELKTHSDLLSSREIPVVSRLPGQCWTRLFGNPALVEGYRIPRRDEANTGMEAPLHIMAQLVNSRKVSVFGGRILIKGYSAILVPTRKTADHIFWHLVSNEDLDFKQNYILYSDTRVAALLHHYPPNLTLSDLETSRHVLGWCGEVKNSTGKSGLCGNLSYC
jgi:hypothetical protein